MQWMRDARYWWGPTYSAEIGDIFLYCGHRDKNYITFAAYHKTGSHRAIFDVPFPKIFEGGEYATAREAERAAEEWFYAYKGEKPIELCPECFTRHKPHENDLCQL